MEMVMDSSHGRGYTMDNEQAREHFIKGLTALHNDHLYLAMTCFEHAAAVETCSQCHACLAYCKAATGGDLNEGIATVRNAMEQTPDAPLNYLLLGRLLMLAGNRVEALDTLRRGTHFESDGEISRELERLGVRQPPVFSSLSRSHPLNRYAGLFLSRLGLRPTQQH